MSEHLLEHHKSIMHITSNTGKYVGLYITDDCVATLEDKLEI